MSKYSLIFGIILTITLSLKLSHVAGTQVPRLRGVPFSKNSLYDPTKDFECLDGSRRIAFEKVNDDYCDCGDASDEPGTAACPNGSFYCQNTGHKPQYIPSGRVNDGVCDCCDASDEYTSKAPCKDICHELGREARAEAEKAAELAKEGNKIRLEMAEEGQKLKTDNMARLEKLKADYLEVEMLKKEKELIKNQIEEKEREALEKYKPSEPEPTQEAATGENQEQKEAEEYFRMLDVDESGLLTMVEIQSTLAFDKDGNAVVTEEEAMYFLSNQEEVTLDEFIDKSWPLMKPFLMKEGGAFKPPSDLDEDQPDHETDDDEVAEESDDEHHDTEDDHEPEQEETHGEEAAPEESGPQYDPETQAIIDEANSARTQYQQAEKTVLELQNEMRSLEGKIERDYGPSEVFASLDGQCFQFTDLEYVYSMCMFGRATQSAKSGGSEVNLGNWQGWTGPDNNKYSKMKFDRGLACWNGPARTVDVELRCGKENKLTWVAEPNRCEYAMVFLTPALCNPDLVANQEHDEL